jgi:hypothetical protein
MYKWHINATGCWNKIEWKQFYKNLNNNNNNNNNNKEPKFSLFWNQWWKYWLYVRRAINSCNYENYLNSTKLLMISNLTCGRSLSACNEYVAYEENASENMFYVTGSTKLYLWFGAWVWVLQIFIRRT